MSIPQASENSRRTQRITDLRCALPHSAWSDADSNIHKAIRPQPNPAWRIIDYQCSAWEGFALQTSRADAPPLRIPLPAQGWQAISLGMAGHYDQAVLDVRLDDGPWHTVRAGGGPLQELPWLMAELNSSHLEIRYPQDIRALPGRLRAQGVSARLLSIALTPLDDEHIAIARGDEATSRPLVYLNDGHSLFWWDADDTDPNIVDWSIGQFADSDWSTCCFCNGGADLVNYPSKTGTLFGELGWDSPNANDIKVARILRELKEQGHDVLQRAIDQAHRQGHDFWFYIRPQAWVGEPPYDHMFRSRFFSEHPEYRCLEADGKPIGKLSLAYPEVRRQLNSILQEALERGADGLGIALVRACPMLRYEAPVLDRFNELYSEDARQVADDDERLRSVWAEFFVLWLEEIRALMQAHNCTGPLAVISGPTPEWHAQYGIDLGDWAERGLIDVVMPYPDREGHVDVAGFCRQIGETPLRPSLGSWTDHQIPLGQLRRRAHDFYQAGAEGLCRWDTTRHLAYLELNRPEIQALWVEYYMGEQALEIENLAGLDLLRYPALDGF